MSNEFREYGIEYAHGGERWTLSVMATSPEDAMSRVKRAAEWGQCFTPHGIAMKVPAYFGPLARVYVWFANLFGVRER